MEPFTVADKHPRIKPEENINSIFLQLLNITVNIFWLRGSKVTKISVTFKKI